MEESMQDLITLCKKCKKLLFIKLSHLTSYGTDCICRGLNKFSTVEEKSNPPKAITYCLDCGGLIR